MDYVRSPNADIGHYQWSPPELNKNNSYPRRNYNPTARSSASEAIQENRKTESDRSIKTWHIVLVAALVAAVIVVVLVVPLVLLLRPKDSKESAFISCNTSQPLYQCQEGQCLPAALRCDGISHCQDKSDEAGCPSGPSTSLSSSSTGSSTTNRGSTPMKFSSSQISSKLETSTATAMMTVTNASINGCNLTWEYYCENTNCVPVAYRCDGQDDCGDNDDETNCACELPERFRCDSGKCLVGSYRCDGFPDCEDQSDEIGCECSDDQYKCENSGQCISKTWLCDGEDDCKAGVPLDEANCVSAQDS